jgi:mRNA-degrading endonuclease RelE of RelBE toxin-antitoxin system
LTTYDDFPLDWKSLDPPAQKSVGKLLETLQNNPYTPELQAACELPADADDRFAYKISEGYVVFWRIIHKSGILTLSSWDSLTVQITGIAPASRL